MFLPNKYDNMEHYFSFFVFIVLIIMFTNTENYSLINWTTGKQQGIT